MDKPKGSAGPPWPRGARATRPATTRHKFPHRRPSPSSKACAASVAPAGDAAGPASVPPTELPRREVTERQGAVAPPEGRPHPACVARPRPAVAKVPARQSWPSSPIHEGTPGRARPPPPPHTAAAARVLFCSRQCGAPTGTGGCLPSRRLHVCPVPDQ